MRGDDVREWQQWLRMTFRRWDIKYPIDDHGVYDAATRAATASMCMALGLSSAEKAMEKGVTPELRTKLRHRRLTATERARYLGTRVKYRRALRKRFESGGHVHTPVARIITDDWGYHPPVHDGIDLICPPKATLFAICDGEVTRADADGWWGKGAPSKDVASKGDGIIIIRCSTDAGPFKKGLNMCYGHAEAPAVRVGEKVRAGERIGRAGFANAWHIHFMVNNNGDTRGVGDRNPRPFTDYARSHT
jgi:murein DD-endopeptidase MepM/ murein hydrolase activator NlpD